MGFPPGITSPREDCGPRATPSSDNPLLGKLFLVETLQEYNICIIHVHYSLNLLQVQLKRHAFIFGSAVVATRMYATDDVSKRYQDFFYDLFHWATLENAHKWKQMENERVSE